MQFDPNQGIERENKMRGINSRDKNVEVVPCPNLGDTEKEVAPYKKFSIANKDVPLYEKTKNDDILLLFEKIILGDKSMSLKPDFYENVVNDPNFIDQEIEESIRYIDILKKIKENLNFFRLVYILTRLKVCSFREIKILLGLKHNKSLSRLLSILSNHGIIRPAGINQDLEIQHLLDLKSWHNKRDHSHYEISSKYSTQISDNLNNIKPLMDSFLVQEIEGMILHYDQVDKDFLEYKRKEAIKFGKQSRSNISDFNKLDNFFTEKYSVGEQILISVLIREIVFYLGIVSSERKAKKWIGHLITDGYLSLKNIENNRYVVYNGIEGIQKKKRGEDSN